MTKATLSVPLAILAIAAATGMLALRPLRMSVAAGAGPPHQSTPTSIDRTAPSKPVIRSTTNPHAGWWYRTRTE